MLFIIFRVESYLNSTGPIVLKYLIDLYINISTSCVLFYLKNVNSKLLAKQLTCTLSHGDGGQCRQKIVYQESKSYSILVNIFYSLALLFRTKPL